MINTFFKLFALSGLLLLSKLNYSQNAVVQDATNLSSLTLNECGNVDTMYIVYRGVGDSIRNVTLTDSFPDYFRVTGYVSSANVLSADLSDFSKPVFMLADAGFTVFDTLMLLVSAECDANTGQTDYKHYMSLTFDKSGTNYTQLDSSNNYISGIKAPVLQLNPVGTVDVADAVSGTTYCRKWKALNSGVGSTLDSFTFRSVLEAGLSLVSLSVNGVAVTPIMNGDTIIYGIGLDLRNQGAFPGDTILFEECFELIACTNSSNSSEVSAFFGCFNTPECRISTQSPNVTTDAQTPNLLRTFTMKRTTCFGQEADTAIIVYRNTGGTATNILTHLASSTNGMTNYSDSRKGYLDTATLTIQVNSGPVMSYTVSSSIETTKSRAEWSAGYKADAVFWNLDTLLPGDTVTFKIAYAAPCFASSNENRGSFSSNCGISMNSYVNALTTYDDLCGVSSYTINRSQQSQYMHTDAASFGPTDLDDGDTGRYYIEMTRSQFNTMASAASQNGYFEVVVNLPTKLIWDKDTAGIIMDRVSGLDGFADSVYYDHTLGVLKLYFPLNRVPTQGASIPINLYLDCSAPGDSGIQSIDFQIFRVASTNCMDTCKMAITCKSTVLTNLHCPGNCVRGGVSPEKYEIKRITLGSPDNDENGLPDSSGGIDFSKVRTDRVLPGDTLEGIMKGIITRGAESPASFTYGYASSEFDANGNLFTSAGATIEIYDASTSNIYIIDNLPETVSTSTGTRKWSWDYSVDTLSNIAGSTLPSSFVYDSNDSIVIKSKFVFTEHLGGVVSPNIVDNEFYVSHYANPTSDTAKYRCDDYSGSFTAIGYYITNSQPGEVNINSCGQAVMEFRMYHSVGVCCTYAGDNWFPYEYRPRLFVDTFYLETPAGYVLDSVNFSFQHTEKNNESVYYNKYNTTPSGSSPAVYNGTTRYHYDIGQYYDVNGGDIPVSDEGFIERAYVYLSPSCEVADGLNEVHTGWNYIKLFEENGYSTSYNNVRDQIRYAKPDLDISNVGGITKTVGEPGVFWDFRVRNNSNNADALNVWLGFNSSSGGITVDSVVNLGTGLSVSEMGGIFAIDNQMRNTSGDNFRVFASYTSCLADSMMIYTGWDCGGYPTSLATATCRIDSVQVNLNPINPQLQTNTVSRPPRNGAGTAAEVSLCDTLEYIISVSQRNEAIASNLLFDIRTRPGLFLLEDSVFVSYPNTSSEIAVTVTTLNSVTRRITLSDHFAHLDTFGLDKFSNAPENEYRVRMKFYTDCDFVSGRNIQFLARGTSPCGASLPVVTEQDRITITGAPSAKLYAPEVRINLDSFNQCSGTDSARLILVNNELSSTTTSSEYTVLLPFGVNYIAMSERFYNNAFTTIAPIVSIDGNQERLTWVSDGVPANDSAIWVFDYTISDSIGMCGLANFEVGSTTSFSATCGGSSCNSSILNSSGDNGFIVSRPRITFSSNTVNIKQDTATLTVSDSMMVSLVLSNLGYPSTNLNLNIYDDVNADGVVDAGDVLMLNRMLTMSGSSLAFDTLLVGANGTYSCPVLVEVVPTCDCDNDTIVSSSSCNLTAVPVDLISFEVRKKSTTAELNWTTASELNSDRFEIERKIEGEEIFTKIGEVGAQGFSTQIVDYRFSDNIENKNGEICYRLKQVDYDAQYAYSDVQCVLQDIHSDLAVYPNPTSGVLNVRLVETYLESPLILKLFNSQGIELLSFSPDEDTQIDLSSYSDGVYFLRSNIDPLVLRVVKISN